MTPIAAPEHVRELRLLRDAIAECRRCPRLRTYCERVAREKKRAYRDETYWGRPVPGFGDPDARLLIVGLAPAAHGANRTGRIFTGDGTGGSGDFLMAALHRAGFANLPTSTHPADGLRLNDVYIAASVRCAPPANKPAPEEITACLDHLAAEIALLPRLQAVVTLGKIAWDAWFRLLARHTPIRPRPAFAHGAVWRPSNVHHLTSSAVHHREPSNPRHPCLPVAGVFHPSRQNTNTGKLTAAMYDEAFGGTIRTLLER